MVIYFMLKRDESVIIRAQLKHKENIVSVCNFTLTT